MAIELMSEKSISLPEVLGGCPEENAYRTLTLRQKLLFAILAVITLCSILYDCFVLDYRTVLFLNAILIVFYVAFMFYKFILINISIMRSQEIEVSAEELALLKDDDLPVYTILVPLYHETETFSELIGAINRLDYPKEKLDVKLLMEEDDEATIGLSNSLSLGQHFHKIVVPDALPKTKPKACNVGLQEARGEYLVIYDAEDRPEPDQLKKAVVAFKRLPNNVACLQAKLNFYNPHQNLLTRWFTLEYSTWFDLYLPGLTAVGAPIPLGGTSNHFKMEVLRKIGGWDPFNVTEDCDLGIRLHKAGHRTQVLDSTTWEEACSSLWYWIRQRTRWAKGYMQTLLVHTRNQSKLLRVFGAKNSVNFYFIFGGTTFCTLINPLYWVLLILWLTFRPTLLTVVFPGWIMALGLLCLIVGNFVFIYASAAGALTRKNYDLVKLALVAPFYWVLISVASWRAVFQLFWNPYYWEKTKHGLFTQSNNEAAT